MRNAATTGPTRTENVRPACVVSRSRAHGSCSNKRFAAAVLGVMPVRRTWLRVLLDSREQPSRRAVDRLHKVPHLLERLRNGIAVLAQRAVEANRRDVAI